MATVAQTKEGKIQKTFSSKDVFLSFNLIGQNYTLADAAVITILVENSVDLKSEHISKCLAWEEAFLASVREWKDQHSSKVIVSYSAEVRTSFLSRSIFS